MIVVEQATSADVDALIELESSLFVEDAGVHDPKADTTWPRREGRKDFEESPRPLGASALHTS